MTLAPGGGVRRARVVVADDHPAVAKALCNLLEPEFDVVAVVEDGRSLVAAAAELRPDVVITDIAMPVLDGVGAMEEIRRVNPAMPVVCVTILTEPEVRERALAAGAIAFVSKAAAGVDLLPAVRAALRGERYSGPGRGGRKS